MSRHEGVSCDSCMKNNFRGRRYKCLICYDYDLCANCYEDGATSTRHSADHPMQCILTRLEFELYYGGEQLSGDQHQSFTCPYCKKMGFSDATLFEHVSADHTDTVLEVVCPVCAATPSGDPNLVTDDFAGHLSLEHRTGPRDLISFLDEPSGIRHGGVRRIPSSSRPLGGPRSRRSNMSFSSTNGGLSSLSPSSGRETVDPIAELLSQLSGVRRGAPQPSNLQQLQMQIQLERQQVLANRQQQHLERLPRRPTHPTFSSTNTANGNGVGTTTSSSATTSSIPQGHASIAAGNSGGNLTSSINGRDITITTNPLPFNSSAGLGGVNNQQSVQNQINQPQFLLTRLMTPVIDDAVLAQIERDQADRSLFVQALLLSSLSDLRVTTRKKDSDNSNTTEIEAPQIDTNSIGGLSNEIEPDRESDSVQHSKMSDPVKREPDENVSDTVVNVPQKGGAIVKGKSQAVISKPSAHSGGNAGSVGSGGNDRRVRGQQSQTKRDIKATSMSSSKEVPNTR